MRKALQDSLKNFQPTQNYNTLNLELIRHEPLNPQQASRLNSESVGLKNIGNSKCH